MTAGARRKGSVMSEGRTMTFGFDTGFDPGTTAGFDVVAEPVDAGFEVMAETGFGFDAGFDTGFDAGFDTGFDAGF